MKNYFLTCVMLFQAVFLTSCSYTVSMAHTAGTASDVIDDTASNTPNLSPTITVPLTPGSSIGITK